ncbi:conserved hypothetical protein [Trichinella spiralis]|uniref:hypothetical protein n=1 Tax=Trichinella spiralis TaxID=6334 RepID=UPI0001EFC4F6|nr:conserved hypothetical protein [Trichinella spiralis]
MPTIELSKLQISILYEAMRCTVICLQLLFIIWLFHINYFMDNVVLRFFSELCLFIQELNSIAIVSLERGIPSKRESLARVDYRPAYCTHRPSLLPIG